MEIKIVEIELGVEEAEVRKRKELIKILRVEGWVKVFVEHFENRVNLVFVKRKQRRPRKKVKNQRLRIIINSN